MSRDLWEIGKDADEAGEQIIEISRWIDSYPANAERSQLEAFLLRAIKISEEVGEMVAAVIGMTGQNPRKGVTHTLDDVLDEAADVALTALAFIESATGNHGKSMPALYAKIAKVHARMVESSSQQDEIATDEQIDAYLRRCQP